MSPSPPPRRLALLALALLLPVLLALLVVAAWLGLTTLGNFDATLAWVQGSPAQLGQLQVQVESHPVFAEGRFGHPALAAHRPAECAPEATAVGFVRLRAFELDVARETLDALIASSGAQPCEANVFLFNHLPSPFDPAAWSDSVVTLLLALALPTGTLLLAYLGFGRPQGLPPLGHWPAPAARTLALALAAAGAGIVGEQLLRLALDWAWPGLFPPHAVDTGLARNAWHPAVLLCFALYLPFLEELAFRAWVIPIASRSVGTPAAVLLSVGVYVGIQWPIGGPGLVGTAWLGAVLALLWVRTRSLPACVLAHGLCSLAALAMHANGWL